jgi:fermentation-respiration switch protein FrsA (DUF1100 family)
MKLDQSFDVRIPSLGLAGTLRLPETVRSLVAFAHGSGPSRFSIRNIAVGQGLNERGFATLLFDLLTPQEEHGVQWRAAMRPSRGSVSWDYFTRTTDGGIQVPSRISAFGQ